MFNLFTFIKLSISILLRDASEQRESQPESKARLAELQSLYTQLMFLTRKKMRKNFTSSPTRINIALGLDWNDVNYCKEKILPKISNMKYLKSLPKNTAGKQLHKFYKDWTFDELYNERYKEDILDVDMISDERIHKLRMNVGRHIFFTHDLYHVLFQYDTSPFGEALIQAVTWKQVKNIGLLYVSFLVTCRVAWKAKSLKPFFILKEALKIGEKVNKNNLIEHSLLYFLKKDVDDLRKEFGFEQPIQYLEWNKRRNYGI
jgi:ubiquinone biosynthesis protein Coq4